MAELETIFSEKENQFTKLLHLSRFFFFFSCSTWKCCTGYDTEKFFLNAGKYGFYLLISNAHKLCRDMAAIQPQRWGSDCESLGGEQTPDSLMPHLLAVYLTSYGSGDIWMNFSLNVICALYLTKQYDFVCVVANKAISETTLCLVIMT